MPNQKHYLTTVVVGAVTFAIVFYFFLLPLITAGLEVIVAMMIDYCFKLLHKLKVVGTILAGTTVLYYTQGALKRVDWKHWRIKIYSLLPSWPLKRRIKDVKDEQGEKSEAGTYPLQKVFLIASEMLSTEESYVKELRIIEELFHERIESEKLFSQEVLKQMFANVRTMYQFHQQFLLPSLQERMAAWKEQKEKFIIKNKGTNDDSQQKVGDIFVEKAPFLTMYTTYIENFDNAMNTIDKQRKRNKKFAAIMDEIQAAPELHRLSLQHHMLAPVQRIPRYKLLLEDYIKRLPEDSSDLESATKALELVEKAASHSNDTMKRMEHMKKMMEVEDLLGRAIILSDRPTREFIKEGKVSKIATGRGDTLKDTMKDMNRYLYLFDDILLLCSTNSLTKRVSGGSKYKLRMKFEFDSLVVSDTIEGEENERSFRLSHPNSPDSMKIELNARSIEEKEEWIKVLNKTLKMFNDHKAESKAQNELQERVPSEPKLSLLEALQDTKSDPQFLLNGNEYENDSDAPSNASHDIDILAHDDAEDEDFETGAFEDGIVMRHPKSSTSTRHSVKSLSIGRSRSPAKNIKKKSSTISLPYFDNSNTK